MLHLALGIFGCRERVIITAKISACRTKQNADLGRRALLLIVPTLTLLILPALTVRIPTVHTPLILPALTKWFLCLAPAVISCITILPTPPFTATAR